MRRQKYLSDLNKAAITGESSGELVNAAIPFIIKIMQPHFRQEQTYKMD